MKFDVKACVNRILQILLVALLSFSLDYLIIRLTSDDSIWLGPSIEVVGSVLFSPVVGAVATLINSLIIDYLLYGVIDYSFVTLLEIGSVTLIGIIYRKLCPKGSREIRHLLKALCQMHMEPLIKLSGPERFFPESCHELRKFAFCHGSDIRMLCFHLSSKCNIPGPGLSFRSF